MAAIRVQQAQLERQAASTRSEIQLETAGRNAALAALTAVVRAAPAPDPASQWMGMSIVDVRPRTATVRMTVRADMVNGFGVAHGGVAYSLADSALAFACNSHGIVSGGVDVHMVYSKPAQAGDVLTATATEISRSSRLSHYRVDVVRADGTLVAAMTGTALVSGKPHA